ncbi:MAG TPA: hypothetical protein VG738_12140 [Chitinophagaceae bacterium]|nr:hypothetical protein [Chitinophagaceae bacterium]
MKIAVKYIILLFAFIAGSEGIETKNTVAAIVCAGAFVAYALIEIQDVKILNTPGDAD